MLEKIKALQKTEALIHYISYLYIRYYLCAINIGITMRSIFFIMCDAVESHLFKTLSQHIIVQNFNGFSLVSSCERGRERSIWDECKLFF
jgi:hypothetical protein